MIDWKTCRARQIICRSFRSEKQKWILLFAISSLIGAFIILTSEVREHLAGESELIGRLDQNILEFFAANRVALINTIAVDLTALGSSTVLTLITIVFSVALRLASRMQAMFQLLSVSLGTIGLTCLLKSSFERSRPPLEFRVVDVQGYSYPSGHTLAAASILFTIAIILSKSRLCLLNRI